MPKNLDEFEKLKEEKPAAEKTSNEELIKFLGAALHTTKEVAEFLKVENGTAYSRLKRLDKNGVITRKWDGQRSWWVTRKAVGMPEVPPQVPAEEQ